MKPTSELTLNRPLWIISRHQDLLWFHGSVIAGLILLGWGILFGLFWYGPRTLAVAAATDDLIRNILLGFGWGIAFHHYYTDSRIWKVRRYPSIAQSLDAGAVPSHTS
jgi:hypothetical protein